jgi:hypothetical protein
MPSIAVSVPHELGQQEAVRRLEGFMQKLKLKYQDQVKDFQQELTGNSGKFSFSIMGFKVSGTAAIEEKAASVTCDLPFAAMMFKGKIEQEIRDQLTKQLTRGTAPKSDKTDTAEPT